MKEARVGSDPFHPWRPRPWRGLEPGRAPPNIVYASSEVTPYDIAGREVDKATGYLLVSCPQRSSPQPFTLYVLIPRSSRDWPVQTPLPDVSIGIISTVHVGLVGDEVVAAGLKDQTMNRHSQDRRYSEPQQHRATHVSAQPQET